jgi:hypothetical protein
MTPSPTQTRVSDGPALYYKSYGTLHMTNGKEGAMQLTTPMKTTLTPLPKK